MFNQPLVSIILTSYNHEDYIEEAIQSVLDQNIKNIELIIIDDGSTDRTPEILNRIKDKRIKIILIKENRRFQIRNMAISISKGKYIAFQNSDDKWKKGKLEKQIDILENDKKISVCFTDVNIIDESGNLKIDSWASNIFSNTNQTSSSWLRHFFDRGNCLCISSAVTRRKLITKFGNFNPNLIQLSDFDLWIRMAAVGEFEIINEKLTNMRIVGEKNISKPNPTSHRRSNNELLDVLMRFIKEPVIKRLPDIFPEFANNIKKKNNINLLGCIAQYSWTLSPIHILFANQIISEILIDRSKREELYNIFGEEIIHEYIKNRGKIGITSFE